MRVSEGVCPELNSWILGYMLKYLHIMRSNNRPALLIFARQYIINATRWLKNLYKPVASKKNNQRYALAKEFIRDSIVVGNRVGKYHIYRTPPPYVGLTTYIYRQEQQYTYSKSHI